jgi:hypothetical protein
MPPAWRGDTLSDGDGLIGEVRVANPLRQTSCRRPFHADDPRQSDTTCKRINIRHSS